MKPKFLCLKEAIDKDKRRCERLFLPLQIYYARQPSASQPSPAWNGPFLLDNISGSGLSFRIQEKIEEGSNLNIRIHYTSQEDPITMIGQVIRCHPDQESGESSSREKESGYVLGLHIYKIRKGDRKKFIKFISDNILTQYIEY